MLVLSTAKIARVIALARTLGPDHPHLGAYIGALNVDEQANLVALMWVGRESYPAAEFDRARREALQEATAPTEEYLRGVPDLAELLEAGMDALGLRVSEVEAQI